MHAIFRTCAPASFLAALLIVSTSSPAASAPPQPSFGSAVVDGDPSEWNLAADFFANMYRAGDPTKPLESKLYLRYDCNTQTVFALVLGEPGVPVLCDPSPQTNWIALDTQSNKVVSGISGNDGAPPDFEFINCTPQATPPDTSFAEGWEASFTLGPGSYNIIGHAEVYDELKGQTSATTGFPGTGPSLVIDCATPARSTTWGRLKELFSVDR